MKAQRHIGRRIYGALLLAMLVSGCGVGSVEMFFVNPGSFDYLSCADLGKATQLAQEREQELKALINRAEQGTFGAFVAATAYRSQYLKAQGELKLLAETAQNKNCTIDPLTKKIDGSGHGRELPAAD